MSEYAKKQDTGGARYPSHVITHGAVLDMGMTDHSIGGHTIRDELDAVGYREVWHGWQPFDILLQDEHERGGVRIWSNLAQSA